MNFKSALLALIGSLVVVSQFARIFTSPTPLHDQSITFVLAHPDDETMFFGPTVRHVTAPEQNNKVSILVLSNGNAEALGEIREAEMLVAADELGIPREQVKIVNDPRLPDSMTEEWDYNVVAEHIAEAAKEWETTSIITFDEHGASGHTNHKQAFIGSVRYGTRVLSENPDFAVYSLYSVPFYRKYLFSLDSIMSRLQRLPQVDYTLIAGQTDYHVIRSALVKGHKSQITWYRRLWSLFSRYMIVNDLGSVNLQRQIEINRFQDPDARLVLNVVASKRAELDANKRTKEVEASPTPYTRTKKEKVRYRERKSNSKSRAAGDAAVTRQKPSLAATAPAAAASAASAGSAGIEHGEL